jgi:DNA-binding cell septation regulator SpoVG
MEIRNMRKINKPESKIRAFFTVSTKNFDINDMKLIEGEKGIFVAFPSREYTNGKGEKKFQPIIWCKDVDFIKAINDEALKIYRGDSPPADQDIPF